MYFNVFEAAPENERDGPNQQGPPNAGGKVSTKSLRNLSVALADSRT